ncbi:hypothetical protein N752_17770 [Desulforamulus aquiferis]|nr:hypothetical protein N752_17770 [Desulforamulus aquiferis]
MKKIALLLALALALSIIFVGCTSKLRTPQPLWTELLFIPVFILSMTSPAKLGAIE